MLLFVKLGIVMVNGTGENYGEGGIMSVTRNYTIQSLIP
jgi:hypothetical protein